MLFTVSIYRIFTTLFTIDMQTAHAAARCLVTAVWSHTNPSHVSQNCPNLINSQYILGQTWTRVTPLFCGSTHTRGANVFNVSINSYICDIDATCYSVSISLNVGRDSEGRNPRWCELSRADARKFQSWGARLVTQLYCRLLKLNEFGLCRSVGCKLQYYCGGDFSGSGAGGWGRKEYKMFAASKDFLKVLFQTKSWQIQILVKPINTKVYNSRHSKGAVNAAVTAQNALLCRWSQAGGGPHRWWSAVRSNHPPLSPHPTTTHRALLPGGLCPVSLQLHLSVCDVLHALLEVTNI